MANNELQNKIKTIISNHLNVKEEEITSEKSLIDLGADSLDAVELMMEIENKFDISIPDTEMEKLSTVGDIQTYLESH
jgi:acyl carrier protein